MITQLLKIYGERNTGTNYLGKLIDLNLQLEQLPGVVPDWLLSAQKRLPAKEFVRDAYFSMTFQRNLGWKHMYVKSVEELQHYAICSNNLTFATLSKNPYSWLLSLYRKPYHQNDNGKQDFESFLASPWQCVGRDNVVAEIASPVELWNLKNASYMQLDDRYPVAHLSFEELLLGPEKLLKSISDLSSCKWKLEKFRNYDQSTKESSKNSNFYRDYYLNEKWKQEYSTLALETVNSRLDDQVMDFFRYQRWDGA